MICTIEIHEPNTSANIENTRSIEFFQSLHLNRPKWPSQHEIVSTTAGILIPRTEKNIAPTNDINGSRSGTSNATTTVRKQEIHTFIKSNLLTRNYRLSAVGMPRKGLCITGSSWQLIFKCRDNGSTFILYLRYSPIYSTHQILLRKNLTMPDSLYFL